MRKGFGLFSGRKKKTDIDESFDRVRERISSLDDWDDPKKLEHYILDSCEQIVSLTKEIESERREDRLVRAYLNDITKLERLTDEEAAALKSAAGKAEELSNVRLSYQSTPRALTEAEFIRFQENAEEIPKTIRRMDENERFQRKTGKDMNFLEAERSQAEIDLEDAKAREKHLKVFDIAVVLILAALVAGLFVLQASTGMDLEIVLLLSLLLATAAAFMIFIRAGNIRRDRKRAIRGLNTTISVLNVVKMKYAAVTRAIDFVQREYEVDSAETFEKKWDMYNRMVEERERYRRANLDLSYYTGRIIELLKKAGIADAEGWSRETAALSDPKEMVEVRHRLNARRHKIAERIAENIETIRMERQEIDRMMEEHDFYMPEIVEIIGSVDRICGLKKN